MEAARDSSGHRLAAAVLGGLSLLLLLAGAIGITFARLPPSASGMMAVAFPPGSTADDRLLALARADGRLVRFTSVPGVVIAEGERDGFAGRLREAGALAAFAPAAFTPFAFGGCIGPSPMAWPHTPNRTEG